jgi:hypothetical protein
VLSGEESIRVVARLVMEQERVGDLPAMRLKDLEPEVDPCSAGSERERRAHPPAGS